MAKFETCAPVKHGIPPIPLTVANTDVVYSDSFVLIRKNFFGLEVQFSSDTDVNVQVDLEQSNVKETTPNVADSNFVVAIDEIDTITDENVHLLAVAPVVAIYARLKLTGLSTGIGNSATTKLIRANWLEVEA